MWGRGIREGCRLADTPVVCGQPRPDGIGTVTVEEKDMFAQVKERLRILLEHQITHFRYASVGTFSLLGMAQWYLHETGVM